MSSFPETRDSLIHCLSQDADRAAWEQFERIYHPVIYRLARGRGLQHADAEDIAQQVLISVAGAIGRWERQQPQVRFRHWLKRIARNAIINAISRQAKDRPAGGTTAGDLLRQQPQEVTDQEIEVEFRRQLYLQAAERVQDEIDVATWQAFELSVVEDLSIEATAQRIGKTKGSVYAARSRVMRRLRKIVRTLEKEHEQ